MAKLMSVNNGAYVYTFQFSVLCWALSTNWTE